jgi:hypothetical protein
LLAEYPALRVDAIAERVNANRKLTAEDAEVRRGPCLVTPAIRDVGRKPADDNGRERSRNTVPKAGYIREWSYPPYYQHFGNLSQVQQLRLE